MDKKRKEKQAKRQIDVVRKSLSLLQCRAWVHGGSLQSLAGSAAGNCKSISPRYCKRTTGHLRYTAANTQDGMRDARASTTQGKVCPQSPSPSCILSSRTGRVAPLAPMVSEKSHPESRVCTWRAKMVLDGAAHERRKV